MRCGVSASSRGEGLKCALHSWHSYSTFLLRRACTTMEPSMTTSTTTRPSIPRAGTVTTLLFCPPRFCSLVSRGSSRPDAPSPGFGTAPPGDLGDRELVRVGGPPRSWAWRPVVALVALSITRRTRKGRAYAQGKGLRVARDSAGSVPAGTCYAATGGRRAESGTAALALLQTVFLEEVVLAAPG